MNGRNDGMEHDEQSGVESDDVLVGGEDYCVEGGNE